MQRRFLGISELSEYLGIPVGTLYSWTSMRKIPYCKMGKVLRFDLQAIEGWIREREIKPHKIWEKR